MIYVIKFAAYWKTDYSVFCPCLSMASLGAAGLDEELYLSIYFISSDVQFGDWRKSPKSKKFEI